jgi:hypothetical protein
MIIFLSQVGAEKSMYYKEPPEEIAGEKPIEWNGPRFSSVKKFESVLANASDEKPLQRFFEDHPEALLSVIVGGPHQVWLLPLKRLDKADGRSLLPDFLICDWSSLGPSWVVVELESLTVSPTNSKGVSVKCYRAVQQIKNYRTYLATHSLFLGDAGWPLTTGDCPGWVIIGRSDAHRSSRDQEELASFRTDRIEIASYDRLLNSFRNFQNHINAGWHYVRALKKNVTSRIITSRRMKS